MSWHRGRRVADAAAAAPVSVPPPRQCPLWVESGGRASQAIYYASVSPSVCYASSNVRSDARPLSHAMRVAGHQATNRDAGGRPGPEETALFADLEMIASSYR
jgi:hypothetical protein